MGMVDDDGLGPQTTTTSTVGDKYETDADEECNSVNDESDSKDIDTEESESESEESESESESDVSNDK